MYLRLGGYAETSEQLTNPSSTGAIAGDYPKSPWKIFFLALAGLVAVVLFILMNR